MCALIISEIVHAYRYDCLDHGRTHKKKLERYRRQRKQYLWRAWHACVKPRMRETQTRWEKKSRRWIDVVGMTLVREGSSEGWRRELGVGLGDRRYQRRSLGWLVAVTMVVVAAAAEMVVVVEWRQGVGTGGKWGQINANMCGKLHRDRSQDPRGKRGLYVFLCHSLSRNPLCTLSASV